MMNDKQNNESAKIYNKNTSQEVVEMVSHLRSPTRRDSQISILSEDIPQKTLTKLTLTWDNVQYVIHKGDPHRERVILHNISGYAQPGKLTVILGPSGAGKSSLLNAISGRLQENSCSELVGSISVNHVRYQKNMSEISAYVMQDTCMFPFSTVAETLEFRKQMLMHHFDNEDEANHRVRLVAEELQLNHLKKTIIGNESKRGLSGGEKKRVNIALDLLKDRPILFLDEPTSGLDAFQALNVVTVLKDLANKGRTVICTIHQPRSSIVELFDDVILLTAGKCVYNGPANEVVEYFSNLGFFCPFNHNVADFLLDTISIDQRTIEKANEGLKHLETLRKAFYKYISIPFSQHPWGLCINLHDHWRYWKVISVVPDSIAEKEGVKIDWKIIGIDGIIFSEHNIKKLKNKLKDQERHEVIFQLPMLIRDKDHGFKHCDQQEEWREENSRIFSQNDIKIFINESSLILVDQDKNTPAPFFHALYYLTKRVILQRIRDVPLLIRKLLVPLFFNGVYGFLFFQMGRQNSADMQDRTGLLFSVMSNIAFGAAIATAQLIPNELTIIERERQAQLFTISPYLISTLAVAIFTDLLCAIPSQIILLFMTNLNPSFHARILFLVICSLGVLCSIGFGLLISAKVQSPTAAADIVPITMVIFILFSGLYLNENSIPAPIAWVKYLSPPRYLFQAFIVNEFKGTTFGEQLGDDYILALGFEDVQISWNLLILAIFSFSYIIISYIILAIKNQNYLQFHEHFE
jgi:ABC-type multidrug transport system ATPase subunit